MKIYTTPTTHVFSLVGDQLMQLADAINSLGQGGSPSSPGTAPSRTKVF